MLRLVSIYRCFAISVAPMTAYLTGPEVVEGQILFHLVRIQN